MKRGVSVIDRLLIGLVGLAIIAGGAALVAWQQGRLPSSIGAFETSPIIDATGQSWWPYALGGGGVVLGLLAVWLLVAQLPPSGQVTVALDPAGSDRAAGHLLLDVDAVASRAAAQAREIAGVRSVRSRTTHERGLKVLTLTATTESGACLDSVMTELARVRTETALVVDGAPLAVRVLVKAR